MSHIELVLLAVSLAMDAFAVSVCGGLAVKKEDKLKSALIFGAWFGFFQFLMPTIGYFAGSRFSTLMDEYSPWVIFLMLCYIGYDMIKESREDESCSTYDATDHKNMLTMAVATSLDALAIGISFAFMKVNIWWAAGEIGLITFVVSFLGCECGSRVGAWGRSKAELMGGLVLIGLGVKALLEGLGYL